MINIITRPTLLGYIQKYPKAKLALEEWYHEFKLQNFETINQLKKVYGNASLVGENRIVFNIKGNDFRLVIKVNYVTKSAYIIWFGTHKEYDDVDVRTVVYKRGKINIMKTLKILKTEDDYNWAVDRTIEIFDCAPDDPDFDELEILLLLIKDYEDKKYPIPYPDAIDAIKFKLNEKGLKNKDLITVIGSESHVSAILSRKRRLTLSMARNINLSLGIPAEILLNAGILS